MRGARGARRGADLGVVGVVVRRWAEALDAVDPVCATGGRLGGCIGAKMAPFRGEIQGLPVLSV